MFINPISFRQQASTKNASAQDFQKTKVSFGTAEAENEDSSKWKKRGVGFLAFCIPGSWQVINGQVGQGLTLFIPALIAEFLSGHFDKIDTSSLSKAAKGFSTATKSIAGVVRIAIGALSAIGAMNMFSAKHKNDK